MVRLPMLLYYSHKSTLSIHPYFLCKSTPLPRQNTAHESTNRERKPNIRLRRGTQYGQYDARFASVCNPSKKVQALEMRKKEEKVVHKIIASFPSTKREREREKEIWEQKVSVFIVVDIYCLCSASCSGGGCALGGSTAIDGSSLIRRLGS